MGDLGGGKRSGCGMVTGDGEGLASRQTILQEVQAEDRHPGGGRLTESRVEMEGGARTETGRRDLE